MNSNYIEIWQNCLSIIREHVDETAYKTWFEPIIPRSLEMDTLTIQVPNRYFYEWLEDRYIQVLQIALLKEIGINAKLKYSISKEPAQIKSTQQQNTAKEAPKHPVQGGPKINEQGINPFAIPGIQKIKIQSNLNPYNTFENYIEGDCNRLARAAGVAVAKKPGSTSFNPLMIFGDTGLGKTHLAHAIGNEVLRTQPDKVVLYVSSDHFTNQFINALANNAASQFTSFHQNVDVLIVDDIQFFKGKQQTQDIFFNIFNYLHMQNKQLIFTCDRPPKDLSGMQERLISRFKWGLSADIQAPSLETRMAIIQQKMAKDGIELPHNVTEYLSYSVRTNVRELEGVLISLIAEAALNQREIDMDLAKEVISKFVDHVSNEISIEFIQKIVASYYNIPVEQLKDKTRKKLIVTARKLSMYLAKQLSDKSLVNIGEYFGNRDHSTVIHAIKSIEEMLQKDDRFKNVVNDLTKKIKTNTGNA